MYLVINANQKLLLESDTNVQFVQISIFASNVNRKLKANTLSWRLETQSKLQLRLSLFLLMNRRIPFNSTETEFKFQVWITESTWLNTSSKTWTLMPNRILTVVKKEKTKKTSEWFIYINHFKFYYHFELYIYIYIYEEEE